MAKNTGKTTTLNALLRRFASSRPALTSIGLDGEDLDQVTFLPKPRIHVSKGSVLATARQCLDATPTAHTILEETSHASALGAITLIRAEEDGHFLVAGPTTNTALEDVIERLKRHADKVFVDGAFNRRTFATIAHVEGVVLATGASVSPDMETTVLETVHVAKLLQAPAYPHIPLPAKARVLIIREQETHTLARKDPETLAAHLPLMTHRMRALHVRGAITTRTVRFLIRHKIRGIALIAEDAGRLLYGRKEAVHLEKLGIEAHVLEAKPLLAITINPFSPHGEHYPEIPFINALEHALPGIPVINVLKKE